MINIENNTGPTTIHLPNIGGDYDYVKMGTYNTEINVIKDNIYNLLMNMNEIIPDDVNTEIINEINNKLDRIIAILERL